MRSLPRLGNRVAWFSGRAIRLRGDWLSWGCWFPRIHQIVRAANVEGVAGPVLARNSKPASPAHVDWLGAKLARLIGGGGASLPVAPWRAVRSHTDRTAAAL
jgi:hypothetical protein